MPEIFKKIVPIVTIVGLILALHKSGLLSRDLFIIVEAALLLAALIYLYTIRKYFLYHIPGGGRIIKKNL